jgi:hypothetical protein
MAGHALQLILNEGAKFEELQIDEDTEEITPYQVEVKALQLFPEADLLATFAQFLAALEAQSPDLVAGVQAQFSAPLHDIIEGLAKWY